ncbi:MAG: UvrD/REP helicase, helicase / ATP-dependent helicase PcrA [Candidatus Taylorbacteria bacterium]|nr:UvrD/REP helicase, helicase / ATP-dependent helicase PcrA [Candidatus Taylorbacteria bacterium]
MNTEAFEKLYKNLNKEQKKAVDTIDGPVMVIAGPGTGKTSILTLRIANILKQTDTPPHGILAITYTDAGVKAMRAKLQRVIGGRAHEVRIHTFHGFAAAIIAEHPDHFMHLKDLKQMTSIEQESLIRSILLDPELSDLRPLGKPDNYISPITRTIDDAKREALSPAMVAEHAEKEKTRITEDPASISSRGVTKGQLKAEAKESIAKCERTVLFAKAYAAYETKKREAGRMDFNDLIIELLAALRNDELLLRLIQEQFLYIHVDEHQDTNDAQNYIVALIAEFFETPNIFIVGDEKQAIYRFQGASVENFLLMQKRWPSMEIISLATNYRSHQSILDASFGMIEKNYEDGEHANLRIRLKSGSEDAAKPVDVVIAENAYAADLHLVRELKAIAVSEPAATVAIITRRNRDLDRIIRLLESHDVEVSSERSVDIFSHPVGMLFFDLIEFLVDPTRTDLLAKTVIAGMWGIPFNEAVEIIRALRSGSGQKEHFDIGKNLPGLVSIRKELLSDGAVGFLVHAAMESGFTRLVAADPSYVYIWRGIVALAESLARESSIHDPSQLMKQLLEYRLSAETKAVKVTVGAPDVPIHALTAHGSKGLEFDYVFIPHATEEAWVGRNRGSSFILPNKKASDSDIRDNRRLFYVALTRARKHVTILTPLEESDGKILTEVRFISELDPGHISINRIPRAEIELSTLAAASAGSDASEPGISPNDSKFIDLAKRVLTDKGLSVTALNHFLACPNTFLYQSILKLPQAPAVPAEKGNAMHAALSAVWTSEKRDEATISDLIVEKTADYFDQSLLSVAEKAAIQKELSKNAPAVAKALVPHFALASSGASVFTEHWVKTNFTGSYEGKPIDIPIHGKLDAIVDTGSEVLVFDYKTKQSMSVNEIKGETKNSDGAYFRQLVFYRMLLGDDFRWKGKAIIPALVFVSPDDKGRCPTVALPIEPADIESLRENIQTLIESVWSGRILAGRCDDEKCEWCGMRELFRVRV